jgi:hypothetical protein
MTKIDPYSDRTCGEMIESKEKWDSLIDNVWCKDCDESKKNMLKKLYNGPISLHYAKIILMDSTFHGTDEQIWLDNWC